MTTHTSMYTQKTDLPELISPPTELSAVKLASPGQWMILWTMTALLVVALGLSWRGTLLGLNAAAALFYIVTTIYKIIVI